MPWEIKENDTLESFSNRYQQWKNIYTKGIDYRYCIFNHIGKDLKYLPALDKQWKNMNISPNYLGEANSIESIIESILQLPFKPNYITMVTKKGILYCVSYGRLLRKPKYQVEINDGQLITITTDKYMEN